MKTSDSPCERGFTRCELCAGLGVLALGLAVVWPALAGNRTQADRLVCLSNLAEIGRAYNLWAADHGDFYPFLLTAAEGGIRYPHNGLEVNAWYQYSWVSNELSSARVLSCPSDRGRRVAESFTLGTNGLLHPQLRNNAISYFLSYASATLGGRVLAGDRNVSATEYGACSIFGQSSFPRVGSPRLTVTWDERLHATTGNLLYSDGSAETQGNAGLSQAFPVLDDGGGYHLMIP